MIKLEQCYSNRMCIKHWNGWENRSVFHRQIEPKLINPVKDVMVIIRGKLRILFWEYIFD